MGEELVSILIPVYNRENIVKDTIQSALQQTYENTEIIIVDNCSTDNTWTVLREMASKYPKLKIFQNEENLGPVKNWSRCLSEAKGVYGKILFSDDLISNNFIENCLNVLDEDTAFVMSEIKVFGGKTDTDFFKFRVKESWQSSEYLEDVLFKNTYGFPVSPGCSLFRLDDLKKSLIIDIPNPFNLDFNRYGAGNDLLIFLLTAIRYPKIKIAKNATSYFRLHEGSFTISNKLAVYYDFSKYYFIKHHRPEYLSKFKSHLKMVKLRSNEANPILELIDSKVDISYIASQYWTKFLKKIKN